MISRTYTFDDMRIDHVLTLLDLQIATPGVKIHYYQRGPSFFEMLLFWKKIRNYTIEVTIQSHDQKAIPEKA